jgi:hypothetical protein
VEKVGKFTQRVVAELRQRLSNLQPKADKAAGVAGPTAEKDTLMEVRRCESIIFVNALRAKCICLMVALVFLSVYGVWRINCRGVCS